MLTKLLIIFISFIWWENCGNMAAFTSDFIVFCLLTSAVFIAMFSSFYRHDEWNLFFTQCSLSWMHLLAVEAILSTWCVVMAKSRSNVINKSWRDHGIFLLLRDVCVFISTLSCNQSPEPVGTPELTSQHRGSWTQLLLWSRSSSPLSIWQDLWEGGQSRPPDWLLRPHAHVRQREGNLGREKRMRRMMRDAASVHCDYMCAPKQKQWKH